jgi:hypothetical protein
MRDGLFTRYEQYCVDRVPFGHVRATKQDHTRVMNRPIVGDLLRVRFKPDVGVCTVCTEIDARRKAVDVIKNRGELDNIDRFKKTHENEWSGRRKILGRLEASPFISYWNTDAADSKKTRVPSLLIQTKSEVVISVVMKLQGVFISGVGLWLFVIPEYVKTGANMVCTVLMLALQKALAYCEETQRVMPASMVLHVDGGSENWNATVVRFCTYLVHLKIFKKVEIIRSPPGHGHTANLDGLYGRISAKAHGKKMGKQNAAGEDVLWTCCAG